MSKDVNIFVHATMSEESITELKTYQNIVNKTGRDWAKIKADVVKSMPHILGAISMMVSMARSFVKAMGVILTDTQEILLDGLQAAIVSLMSIAIAWNMVPGAGQLIFLAVSAAVLGINLGTTAALLNQAEQGNSRLQAAESTLTSIGSLSRQLQLLG